MVGLLLDFIREHHREFGMGGEKRLHLGTCLRRRMPGQQRPRPRRGEEDIARALWWVVQCPPHMDVSFMEIMPTGQADGGPRFADVTF